MNMSKASKPRNYILNVTQAQVSFYVFICPGTVVFVDFLARKRQRQEGKGQRQGQGKAGGEAMGSLAEIQQDSGYLS